MTTTGKRRGRPPGSSLPPDQGRDETLRVRVSKRERDQIRDRAANSGETVSRYVRRKALD